MFLNGQKGEHNNYATLERGIFLKRLCTYLILVSERNI